MSSSLTHTPISPMPIFWKCKKKKKEWGITPLFLRSKGNICSKEYLNTSFFFLFVFFFFFFLVERFCYSFILKCDFAGRYVGEIVRSWFFFFFFPFSVSFLLLVPHWLATKRAARLRARSRLPSPQYVCARPADTSILWESRKQYKGNIRKLLCKRKKLTKENKDTLSVNLVVSYIFAYLLPARKEMGKHLQEQEKARCATLFFCFFCFFFKFCFFLSSKTQRR